MPKTGQGKQRIDDDEANKKLDEMIQELDIVAGIEDPDFYNAPRENVTVNILSGNDAHIENVDDNDKKLDETIKELDEVAQLYDEKFYNAPLNVEDSVIEELSVTDKLNQLKEANDTDGIAAYFHGLFVDRSVFKYNNPAVTDKMAEANEFLKGCMDLGSHDDLEEYDKRREFLIALMKSFTRQYYEDIIAIGKVRDEWEQKIKDGKVEGAELIMDDERMTRKLAHDITLAREPLADAGPECYVTFANILQSNKVRIIPKELDNEKNPEAVEATKIYSGFPETMSIEARDKHGLSDDKMLDYVHQSMNRDMSSLGYEIKGDKLKEGESLFSKIPDHFEKINSCKNEDDLDEYENIYNEKIDLYNCFVQKSKSAVKVFKYFHDELDKLDDYKENSKDYNDTRKYVEEFTTVGSEYIYRDPYINSDLIRPSADYSYIILDKATKNLEEPSDNFADELSARTDISDDHKALANNIYNINYLVRNYNEKFMETKLTPGTIVNYKNIISYIDKERTRRGVFCASSVRESEYGKSLDTMIGVISDSLMNDGIDTPEYDKLMMAVMHRKRIYHKMLSADRAGNGKAKDKYDKLLLENASDIKKQIAKCRKVEERYSAKLNITGNNKDRNKLLDGLSKNMGKNYDTYIDLHVGMKPGMTENDMRKSMAKVLAAYSLKKNGEKFNVERLRSDAKQISKMYMIDSNNELTRGKAINDTIKDKFSILSMGEALRIDLYDIRNNNYDKYVADMKVLSESMRLPKGRSKEYKAFYDMVKFASELDKKTVNMTIEDKAELYRRANSDVIRAVENYVKGKETVRKSDKGNEAFDNSMDALAIVSKFTRTDNMVINQRVSNVIADINKVRKDQSLSVTDTFEKRYGAERAGKAAAKRNAKNVVNNKVNKPANDMMKK